MDEIKLNSNVDSDNENSFVDDQYFDEINCEENHQYEFQSTLSLSQIYRKDFYHYFHTNYYGELENEGPFLASVKYMNCLDDQLDVSSSESEDETKDDQQQIVRAIIRTSKENYDVCESSNAIEEENFLQILFAKAHLSNIQHWKIVQHTKANEKIYQFDKENDERHVVKIGMIYQYFNQINETNILSNNQMTREMEDFINLIADRVQLKGFNKYRGDLDTKSNEHGEYSYFTIFNNYQIMFNIAPIIPSDKNDQQFIQRKRLVANSFICIVFQEEDSIFNPELFSGKVIQAYITVQPTTINEQLYYKIRIWRRYHIRSITDPGGGIYKVDESFGKRFLRLILNTMNIILEKGPLHSKIIQQKQRLKYEHLLKLFSTFNLYSKIDLKSSHLNISDNENETKQKVKVNLRNKIPNTENRFRSPKRHYSSILPRLTEALNKVKPKFNFSSSDPSLTNSIDNQLPTTNQQKIPLENFPSKSNNDNSNGSYYQKNFDQEETKLNHSQLSATMSLVTNLLQSESLNAQKSQSSTSPNTSVSEENICNAITSNDERHDSV